MEKGRPLSGSPSYYDCLWVPCLLGCLNLCFNKCCCDAKTCDLVNDNVSDCCPNGLEVSDESEDNTKSGAMGQSTCSLYWPEMQSPLWVQLLFLMADHKTFLDLSSPKHYTDIVQISLFLPQAIPFWESLRSNQQVHRQYSHLTLTWCSKVHTFMIPVILPSGSGLGVCNKAIILRKTWRIIITQFLNICCFSKCYFCEISQGWESILLGIPTTSDPPTCLSLSSHLLHL